MFGPEIGSELAWARFPDGGPAFASDQMVLQAPTPGFTNLLDCDGGTITAQGAEDGVATVCVDLPGGFLPFTASSNALESAYGLVVTNLDGEVIDVVPAGEGNLGYDFSGSPTGTCLVWGMSYDGDLDPASIVSGTPYDSISASGCVAFSAIPVQVERIYCLPPSCDGGQVYTAAGADEAVGCLTYANTLVHFGYLTQSRKPTTRSSSRMRTECCWTPLRRPSTISNPWGSAIMKSTGTATSGHWILPPSSSVRP